MLWMLDETETVIEYNDERGIEERVAYSNEGVRFVVGVKRVASRKPKLCEAPPYPPVMEFDYPDIPWRLVPPPPKKKEPYSGGPPVPYPLYYGPSTNRRERWNVKSQSVEIHRKYSDGSWRLRETYHQPNRYPYLVSWYDVWDDEVREYRSGCWKAPLETARGCPRHIVVEVKSNLGKVLGFVDNEFFRHQEPDLQSPEPEFEPEPVQDDQLIREPLPSLIGEFSGMGSSLDNESVRLLELDDDEWFRLGEELAELAEGFDEFMAAAFTCDNTFRFRTHSPRKPSDDVRAKEDIENALV